jgi:hypothetical protein
MPSFHCSGEPIPVEITITAWDYLPAEEFQVQDRNDEIPLGQAEMCNLIPPYDPGPYIKKDEIPFSELYGGPPQFDESSILKADTRKNWTEALKKLYENPNIGKLISYNSIRPVGDPINVEVVKRKLSWKLSQKEGKLLHCWFSPSIWNAMGGAYYTLENGEVVAVTAALDNSREYVPKDGHYHGLGAFLRLAQKRENFDEPIKKGIVTYGEPGFYSIDEKAKNAPVAYEIRHGMSDEEIKDLMRRKQMNGED